MICRQLATNYLPARHRRPSLVPCRQSDAARCSSRSPAPGHPPPTAKRIREAILERRRCPRKPVALKVKVLARRLWPMFADACYMVAEPEQLVFLEEALAEMTERSSPGNGSTLPSATPCPESPPGMPTSWPPGARGRPHTLAEKSPYTRTSPQERHRGGRR